MCACIKALSFLRVLTTSRGGSAQSSCSLVSLWASTTRQQPMKAPARSPSARHGHCTELGLANPVQTSRSCCDAVMFNVWHALASSVCWRQQRHVIRHTARLDHHRAEPPCMRLRSCPDWLPQPAILIHIPYARCPCRPCTCNIATSYVPWSHHTHKVGLDLHRRNVFHFISGVAATLQTLTEMAIVPAAIAR